ncbi:NAD+ synthase [Rugosimonospora africana]|uniref:Glutamine-dependent NAD(+) synthetase n=2 Tax=Rugosimonospora africana TaxID=556532 RepID=A0A8J3R231_9ACTN|nr:NAD+ synthase [Rugosimonospora africana]
MRIALAQVNSVVGDIPGNAAIIREWARRAAEAGAHLVAFPEMMLTGYPVEDLVFRESFVAASRDTLRQLAADLAADGLGELPTVVGYIDADGPARLGATVTIAGPPEDVPSPIDRGPRDALALLYGGRVVATYFKHHLPNYGVFDENRYFVPGDTLTVARIGGVDVALTVCEDIWQAGGPFAVARQAGVGLVVNINASPYELNKDDVRLSLVARRAREAGAAVAYVNMIGGQDELVFDGDSLIVDADGNLLTRGVQFTEQLLVHDLELPESTVDASRSGPADVFDDEVDSDSEGGAGIGKRQAAGVRDAMHIERVLVSRAMPASAGAQPEPGFGGGEHPPRSSAAPAADGGMADRVVDEAEVWQALVHGLRDYVRKNKFPSVVIAVSGGIDSAVVAAVACDALGPSNVVGVSMPSSYSSEHSKDDAADLAKRTGLSYRVQPIQPMVDAFLTNMAEAGSPLSGLAEENLQARVRGIVLMALSNQEGHLVLTTGNKSELAVGYSTLYGDSVGGFNPLKDVFKTMVWRLATWRNEEAVRRGEQPPIPENTIRKPPSAELRPGQLDTDSLPDYGTLDPILAGYIDGDLGREELILAGHDAALVDRVLRLVDLAEYKRRQSAPGTKISVKAFGRDRRLPITNRYREAAVPIATPAHDPVKSSTQT